MTGGGGSDWALCPLRQGTSYLTTKRASYLQIWRLMRYFCRLGSFADHQCRQAIYKLQVHFIGISMPPIRFTVYILSVGWPILLCLFSQLERDSKRITQDGADLKEDSRVVQGKFALSRRFLRGSVGTPEGSQTLQAAIGSSSSNVRLCHSGPS